MVVDETEGAEGQTLQWIHPDLEAGNYAICPTSRLDADCVTGYLPAGGELKLTLVR